MGGGALAVLLCGALAGTPDAAALPGPPAGLQGLLSPIQEQDGPPGCMRTDTDRRWPVSEEPRPESARRGWLAFRAWAGDPADCLAAAPVLETSGESHPVPTLESAYEIPALQVLERSGDWHRIRLADGSGWLQAPSGFRYEAWPALLSGKLAYATPAWSGESCETPGQTCRHEVPVSEQPLQVLSNRDHDGETWLEVELTTDGCRDGEARVIRRSWLRARDERGQPTVWFHSRGC